MGRKMYNSTIVVVIVLTAKEAEIVVYIRSKIMTFILFCCLSFFKIYRRERERGKVFHPVLLLPIAYCIQDPARPKSEDQNLIPTPGYPCRLET